MIDVDATVNLARSKDGLTNWESSLENPIVAPFFETIIWSGREEHGWSCDSVYKPFVLYDKKSEQWLLWYNGRCRDWERIGLSTRRGDFGEFVPRSGPVEKLWL
jgi:beta-1,2-mannobiose phosphorylase / 1,2-beta-oligomannan phosphorylase